MYSRKYLNVKYVLIFIDLFLKYKLFVLNRLFQMSRRFPWLQLAFLDISAFVYQISYKVPEFSITFYIKVLGGTCLFLLIKQIN